MTHQERREYVRRELEKLQDLRDEDYWYCWEEQEYTESGRYGDMLTDNQLQRLGEGGGMNNENWDKGGADERSAGV